ncbi:MAG: T9SS type A sorting domain-containing protein [Ignavibacteriae bacterium]|nr:T9SS C-terminal target domain-containing protein [Ignavibacteriota bacterium]NOG99123.1 T9SS type A sorting domain-containing protein [Ignavibacteriota bacterium]
MKSKIIYFFLLLSFQFLQAQTPNPLDFFPSAIGNYWEYTTNYGDRFRTFVKDSIAEDGSKYIFLAEGVEPWFKIDSNLCVYVVPFGINFEWKLYDLNADSADTWMVRPETANSLRREAKVNAIYDSFVFGRIRSVREIDYWDLQMGDTVINQFSWPIETEFLVEGIGEYQTWSAESGPTRILRGCIIDGDTLGNITTDLMDDGFLKLDFELVQNYPNPFNPSTTIEFNLLKDEEINLTIYDMLGRKVAILHKGYLRAGDHRVQWNAEGFASGLYICRLQAGEFTRSIKMLFAK